MTMVRRRPPSHGADKPCWNRVGGHRSELHMPDGSSFKGGPLTNPEEARPVGLILAGAGGKGPFAAGALGALAAEDHLQRVVSVVGASSGALNGAVYAAGLRVDAPEEAAWLLRDLWRDRAS